MEDELEGRMEEGNWRIERVVYDKINLYYKGQLIAENLTESEMNDLGIVADCMRNPWAA